MKATAIILLLFSLFLPIQSCKTIELNYEPENPSVIFYNDKVFIATDTASLMLLVGRNYSTGKTEQIRNEILYRIRNAKNDSIMMDFLTLNIYTDDKRLSYEGAALNHKEVTELIKQCRVKIYYKDSGNTINRICIKKKGCKIFHGIDEVYYDKDMHTEIMREKIYQKTKG